MQESGNGILDEIYKCGDLVITLLAQARTGLYLGRTEMLPIISHNHITTLSVVTKSKMLT